MFTRTTCSVTAADVLGAGIYTYDDGSRIAHVDIGENITVQASNLPASALAEKLEDAAAALRRLELDLDANAVAVPHDDVTKVA
jgi:hypothetical protein